MDVPGIVVFIMLADNALIFFGRLSQGAVIEGPSDVIYYPKQGPVKLTCTISEGSTGWRVNGSGRVFTLTNLRAGNLPGHNITGANSLLVINATNNTQYQCVSIRDAGDVDSDPAYLFIAGPPAMVGNVMIDVDTISADNKNVSFTLNWDEPFANFDPIVNYTITINCSDASCPVILSTNNVTKTTNVSFTTNLSMMTPLSVTASNSIGTSDPTIIVIGAPGHVDMLNSTCAPVDLINRCNVTWNPPANYATTSIGYTVYYFGENITTASDSVNVSMATIDLPAVDSDVNIVVTAVNVFGSGPNSTIFINKILSSSVTNATTTLDTPNKYRALHSVTVTCTINPDSAANMCEVIATADGQATLTRNASITNGMATVTIDGLVCGVTYTIIAAGTLDGDLVGPRSSHGTITAGPCPLITVTTTATITSVSVTDVTIRITSSVVPSAIPSQLPPGPTDSDEDNTGVIIGAVVGGIIEIILIFVQLIIVYYCCKKYKKKRKPGNVPVAMSTIPVYDTVPDPVVSDKVKMESNPAYQVLTSDHDHTNKRPDPAYELLASDLANKGPDPAYQDLSSYSGRASISKQKLAGDVNYCEDIINDQNITMNENPSYAVP